MKITNLINSLVAAAVVGVLLAASAQAQVNQNPVCNALVKVANDLYLANASGVGLVQFTNDGLPKRSASLAPDSRKVAFIPDATQDSITVVDYNLRKQTYLAPTRNGDGDKDDDQSDLSLSTAILTGVSWATNKIVRLDKHLGKDTDRFEFYKVPEDLTSSLRRAAHPALGAVCVMKPHDDDVACLQGNDVTLNSSVIYSDNGFANAAQVDSLTLTVGQSAQVKGITGLDVQLASVVSGITLYVTLPGGARIGKRVNPGDVLTVQLGDQTLGFFPTLPNAAAGMVQITVLSRDGDLAVFGSALTWRGSQEGGEDRREEGSILALIRNTSTGSALTLLEPGPRGQWGVLAQGALNISNPIGNMRFLTPTLLYYETFAEFGTVRVSLVQLATGPVLQFGAITKLPSKLSVTIAGRTPFDAPVLAWACKAAPRR